MYKPPENYHTSTGLIVENLCKNRVCTECGSLLSMKMQEIKIPKGSIFLSEAKERMEIYTEEYNKKTKRSILKVLKISNITENN